MSEIVGLENLPNVYISKITLEDNTTEGFLLNVELELQDRRQNGGMNWSDDFLLSQFLKVNLVGVRSMELSNLMKDGSIVPLPREISRLNSPFVSTNVFGISEFKKISGEEVSMFRKTFTYELSNDVQNLDLYAVCYLDTSEVNSQLGIRLENIYSRYFGAVTSENVLVDGSTKRNTTLFLKPDNSVWAGPVHLQDGRYMEGSFHTDQQHNVLRRITVQNYKITDNRKLSYDGRGQLDKKTTPVLSDLMFSVNNKTDLSGMFVMNIQQFALTKTKHGRVLFDLSQRLFDEYLSTVKINFMTIKRQQIKSAVYRNNASSPKIGASKIISSAMIGSVRDTEPYKLEQSDKIKEVLLFSTRTLRAFQFIDDEKSFRSKGEYQYKAEIRILDTSYDFMESKMSDLRDSLNSLKDLRGIIGRNSNYDFEANKIKDVDLLTDSIVGIVRRYYDYQQYFQSFDDVEKSRLVDNKLKNFTFNNYTLSVHDKFIVEYEKLMDLFSKRYKTTDKENSSGAITDRKSFVPSVIEISRVFADIVNFREFYRSYDYLGIRNNVGFPVVTLDQMTERSRRETSRFFKGEFVLANEDFENLDSDTQNALGDLNTPKMSFFSPLTLIVNDEEIMMEKLDEIDHDKVTTKFMEAKSIIVASVSPINSFRKRQTNTRKPGKKLNVRNRFKFFKNAGPLTPDAPDRDDSTLSLVESELFLGENSEFVNVEENYTQVAKEEGDLQIQQQLNNFFLLPTDTSSNQFDVTVPNNSFTNFMNGVRSSLENLRAAPMQFKALIGSRSTNVKNNILNSNSDALRDVNTKVASEIIFSSFQKIEVFSGYEKDTNGIDILTSPIYTMIDKVDIDENTSYFCRMSYHNSNEFGIKVKNDYKLPVLNRYFFISGADLSNLQQQNGPAISQFNIQTGNEISRNIKFATSNIVTQSQSKNPLKDTSLVRPDRDTQRNAVAQNTTPNRGRVY